MPGDGGAARVRGEGTPGTSAAVSGPAAEEQHSGKRERGDESTGERARPAQHLMQEECRRREEARKRSEPEFER